MKFLTKTLTKSEKFQELTKQIKKKISPIVLSGLTDVEKMHMLVSLQETLKKPICLLTYNEIQAQKLCQDIKSFGIKPYYFPKREIVAYDYIAQSKDLPYERINVLNQMLLWEEQNKEEIETLNKNDNSKKQNANTSSENAQNKFSIGELSQENTQTTNKNTPMLIVTTIEAVMQNMITKEELYQNKIDFKVGKSYLLDTLKETFVKLGYERNELVENKGQFSIRGGIVDVRLI